ncbi:hypothetical protein P8452_69721 [Trifolium repens]|nr:hypothetical protein P8452_69721 [Trifolium repens]
MCVPPVSGILSTTLYHFQDEQFYNLVMSLRHIHSTIDEDWLLFEDRSSDVSVYFETTKIYFEAFSFQFCEALYCENLHNSRVPALWGFLCNCLKKSFCCFFVCLSTTICRGVISLVFTSIISGVHRVGEVGDECLFFSLLFVFPYPELEHYPRSTLCSSQDEYFLKDILLITVAQGLLCIRRKLKLSLHGRRPINV